MPYLVRIGDEHNIPFRPGVHGFLPGKMTIPFHQYENFSQAFGRFQFIIEKSETAGYSFYGIVGVRHH